MKTKLTVLVAVLFAACTFGQQLADAGARLFVVGVPHRMDGHVQSNALSLCLNLMLQGTKPGDRVIYFDAQENQIIADATIPEGKQFANNPKARAVRLQPTIAALKQYFAAASADRADTNGVNQIRVPQFLEMIGSHYRNGPGKPTIVLVGRPFYEDPRDVAFMFGESGYCPSDGHILTNSQSVFGTAHKFGLLKGVTAVHWAYLDDSVFKDDHARSVIRRFWAIYLERLGAPLSSWVSAPPVALDRAVRDVREPVTQEKLDESDTVIEMRRTDFIRVYEQSPRPRPVPVPARDTTAQTQAVTKVPPPVERVLASALAQVPKPTNGEISVAACWVNEEGESVSDKPDVDLYFFAPGLPALSFRRRTVDASFGTMSYLRDVQAPQPDFKDDNWKAAWEAITLPAGTPLEQCECFVNLYRGSSSTVLGVVRLTVGEQSSTTRFRFPAMSGNNGADEHGRSGPCWQEIKLSELTKAFALH